MGFKTDPSEKALVDTCVDNAKRVFEQNRRWIIILVTNTNILECNDDDIAKNIKDWVYIDISCDQFLMIQNLRISTAY